MSGQLDLLSPRVKKEDESVDDFACHSRFASAVTRTDAIKKRKRVGDAHRHLGFSDIERSHSAGMGMGNGLTPDDVIESNSEGKTKCDDCGKFAVTEAHECYACTECGCVSTTQVLQEGYVNRADVTDEQGMRKRLRAGGTLLAKEMIAKRNAREQLKKSIREKGESVSLKSMAEVLEMEMELHSDEERKTDYRETRKDNLNMKNTVERVITRVNLTGNLKIFTRAMALVDQYLATTSVTKSTKFILAAVCVARAAVENGIGLRWWDVRLFLRDNVLLDPSDESNRKVDGTLKKKQHCDSRIYSKWRRIITLALKLNPIPRINQLRAFVDAFCARAVFNNQKVVSTESLSMEAMVKWIGDSHLNRMKVKPEFGAERKSPSLELFFRCLRSKKYSNIPKMVTYLTPESQTKDECIKIWSVAATIVYLVLSVRPKKKNRPTQEDIEAITGVQQCVQMACKKTIMDVIKVVVAEQQFE